MIEKLTKEQEAMIPVYREKYINIGLNTDRINRDECVQDMDQIYSKILKRNLSTVVFCKNPLEQFYLLVLYKVLQEAFTYAEKQKIDISKVRIFEKEDNVYNNVLDIVRNEYQEKNKKADAVLLANYIVQEFKTEVNEIPGETYLLTVTKQAIKQNSMDYVSPYLYGSFDSFYFSFYSFFKEICHIKFEKEDLYNLYEKTLQYGFIAPLETVCFVSEKPLVIYRNEKGLHADLKPALEYEGDFKLFFLNGVQVPEWLVMQNVDELNIKEVLSLKNVEQRAQGLKKLGPDRFEHELKLIDSDLRNIENPYYLYDAGHLFDGEYTPILKMKNPSVPLLNHYEYTSPDCKTVQHALNWRKYKDINKEWNPIELT